MLAGVLFALVFPALATVSGYFLKENAYINSRPFLLCFIAVALNLVLLRVFFKAGADKTARGVILVSFVYLLLFFVFKIHPAK
jgi:hypothetical protein